jgi:hypothetical protein
VKTMIKIDYEKLKKAVDMLYEAIDYSGMHYINEIKTECYVTTIIKGLDGSIEVPVEYLPMLALKLLMEFEHVKTSAEIVMKRFKEGIWE